MKVFNMLTNEDMKRIKSKTDLPLLIEHYKKEIWEWKQKESQWLSDKNLLEGSKKTIEELASKLVEISKVNLTMLEEVEKLKANIARAKEDHQYDNLVHANELKNLKSRKHRMNQK